MEKIFNTMNVFEDRSGGIRKWWVTFKVEGLPF